MTDSNSPDQGPKPFKPDPKKDWYTPPSEPPRKPLPKRGDLHYESEIAGQALQMLINRLKPQEEKAAEQATFPKIID